MKLFKHFFHYGGLYLFVGAAYFFLLWFFPLSAIDGVKDEWGNPLQPWKAVLAAHIIIMWFVAFILWMVHGITKRFDN